MIAVIADDLTGAAELAGIGLSYRLKTEINTIVDLKSDAELLIIATDTRSLPVDQAKQIVSEVTRQLLQLHPRLIFKKIDSVLRGHVIDEVESQLKTAALDRALIIPGNPAHKKKVVDGIYYYEDKPVHLSNYAQDPDFPVRSSDVKQMLRVNGHVHLLKKHQELPKTGIIIGEAGIDADLRRWVEKMDNHTLLAGASGVFTNLLNYLKPKGTSLPPPGHRFNKPRLFVFGSTFHQSSYQLKKGLINEIPVAYITADVIFGDANVNGYIGQVVNTLNLHGRCIMAIQPGATKARTINPDTLTKKMGLMVSAINQQIPVSDLLIEGGATANAILQALGITKMYPLAQLAPGVICLSVPGNHQLSITLKPGSYAWPSAVWAPAN